MFKNLPKLFLSLVIAMLVLTACGGGSESPQQDDSSVDMVDSQGTYAVGQQEISAPATHMSTDGWQTVSDSGWSVDIPQTWTYEVETDGPGGLFITNEDSSVSIFMGYIIAGDPQWTIDENPSQAFHFDSGSTGYMIETEWSIIWIPGVSSHGLSLDIGGGRSAFTNNEEIILQIARSLDFRRVFNRLEYFLFGTASLEDVQRFPDQHIGSLMFLQNFEVRGGTRDGIFDIAPIGDGNPIAATIDMSRLDGVANALNGDIVTVYGSFTGLSDSVVQIQASRVVFNNILPDPVEFLPAVIEVLNMYDDRLSLEHSGENEYLGNGRMNLVIERVAAAEWRPTRIRSQQAVFWVDGYEVGFQHVDENGVHDRLTPFGMDIIHLDTVRFYEFFHSGDNRLTIRVVSELRLIAEYLQESIAGTWRVESVGWMIPEMTTVLTEDAIVTIGPAVFDDDITVRSAMSPTSIRLEIYEDSFSTPVFAGEGRIEEDGRLRIALGYLDNADSSEIAVLERVD